MTDMTPTSAAAALLDGQELRDMHQIMTALYDDQPMTPDRRRDLANHMYVLLGQAILLSADDAHKLSDSR